MSRGTTPGAVPDHLVRHGADLVARLPARWRTDRWLLDDRERWPDAHVLGDDDALLVVGTGPRGTTLTGRGDPARVGALVGACLPCDPARGTAGSPGAALAGVRSLVRSGVGWVTVPRDTDLDPWADALGVARFSTWDRLSTSSAPPVVPGEGDVVPLGADAHGDVVACLAAANPGTSARPGNADDAAWWGVRRDGRIVGVIGAAHRPGAPGGCGSWHLHGLGVLPTERGRGLGAALTARAVRDALGAGADWVSLGMYADNVTARRLYERLGLVTDARNASWAPHGVTQVPAHVAAPRAT